MESLKVLILTPKIIPEGSSGAARHSHNLALGLLRQGHGVEVPTNQNLRDIDALLSEGPLRLTRIKDGSPGNFSREWFKRTADIISRTGGDYELLQVLVELPNRVLTRDMLMDLLRGRQAGPFDRAIDVAVSRLRRKLEDDGRNPQLIKTVRGGGYVLATTVEKG